MLDFVGNVGDLAKLVQGKEGVRPRDDLDSGPDEDWLWADWEDALAVADGSSDVEVDDWRWTPCYDCGVWP